MAVAPGTRIGPYEIAAQIGEGGMGVVYRATDTTLGRDAAIKVLPEQVAQDADRLARFEREPGRWHQTDVWRRSRSLWLLGQQSIPPNAGGGGRRFRVIMRDMSDDASRRARASVRRFASASEADRHDLEYWRAIPDDERVLEVWRLSLEQWRLVAPQSDEPGLSRSVARVHRR